MEQNASEIANTIMNEYVARSEFKRLLLELDITLTDRSSKTLSVLSLFPGEGKSFVVTALAYGTASLLGKRVLVVDCAYAYREESFIGALLPQIRGDDQSTFGVDVVTAQSLAGEQTKNIDFKLRSALASLAPSYDRIFIDAGAIHSDRAQHFDPIIAAKQSGATLIVSSPYSLHRSSVADLKSQIVTSGIPIVGTVYSEIPR